MKKTNTIFLPLILTAFLLVGCKGAKITYDEAVLKMTAIQEHYDDEDVKVPSKMEVVSEFKGDISSTETGTSKQAVRYDGDAKYYFMGSESTTSEETEYTKIWIYYDVKANKTYVVSEDNDAKEYSVLDGDQFADATSVISPVLVIQSAMVYMLTMYLEITEGDERNIYRSSGEGSIYFKVFEEDSDAFLEVEVANYLIASAYLFEDENNYSRLKAKYTSVSTAKPNLNNYELVG